MGNIQDGTLDWSDLVFLDQSDSSLKPYLLKSGDLLFNRTNSAELVGKSAIFDGAKEAVFASYLIRFMVDTRLAIPGFVCEYINSPYGREFISQNMTRAIGQVNISASTMHRMPIPIPSLEQQQSILDRLAAGMRVAKGTAKASQDQFELLQSLWNRVFHLTFAGASDAA
jgi:type I restriction enzyme S subunit